MITKKLSKEFRFSFQDLSQILIWLIFFTLCSGYPGFYDFQSTVSPDLVYCPLQKVWVKRLEPKTPVKYQPFDEICATDTRKNSLRLEISLKTLHPATQKIVFDYLEKGDRAFAELNQLTSSPSRQLLAQTNSETAANNFSQDFGKHEFAEFTLLQAPRPPTFSGNAPIRFTFQFTCALEKISRNINPRSPPRSV